MTNTRCKDTDVVTQDDIAGGLKDIGVRPGMGLIVHSSLKSFGWVEGGPEAVLRALMDVLTPSGTLIMPTFNHDVPFREGGPGLFDPRRTPSGNGVITDRFWRMPGVCRSLNPTHPYAAWGRHARRYTEGHHLTLTMGPESPLGLLCSDGGFCLLMGVSYGKNTFHHVVETMLNAPCLGRRTEAYPVRMPDGTVEMLRTWGFREKGCPFHDGGHPSYIPLMRDVEHTTDVGGSTWRFYRLQDAIEPIGRHLREGLGELPPCPGCPIRPRMTVATVASDVPDSYL